ncbi:MAG: chromate transporter, partial [Acetatifactor sp.]|nr:chromate transporter [Acetatifactor sp.]
TYVGMETAGILGSVCATLGVVTPSFVIILLIAKSYEKFKESSLVKGIMSGLKPAVVGMIGAAVLSVGQTTFFQEELSVSALVNLRFFVSAGIFLLMVYLAFKKKHPILIVCLSAALGIVFGFMLESF